MNTSRNNSVAILIDGGFFLKRYPIVYGKSTSPEEIVKNLYTAALKHVDAEDYLYRIFYYDCRPITKKVHHPITNVVIDYSKSTQYTLRNGIFNELKKRRKVALRLGELRDTGNWIIRPSKAKDLFSKRISIEALSASDVYYEVIQKGVDIRIGVDIASLTLKKQVNKIILISGDEDFIPAAKLARREGIDFVLDPMWNPISEELFEHIDGLHTTCPNPGIKKGNHH